MEKEQVNWTFSTNVVEKKHIYNFAWKALWERESMQTKS